MYSNIAVVESLAQWSTRDVSTGPEELPDVAAGPEELPEVEPKPVTGTDECGPGIIGYLYLHHGRCPLGVGGASELLTKRIHEHIQASRPCLFGPFPLLVPPDPDLLAYVANVSMVLLV